VLLAVSVFRFGFLASFLDTAHFLPRMNWIDSSSILFFILMISAKD
jgi:hypothetical protein